MTDKPNNLVTRRFFLQGSGAVIALPYLASLLPRSARAATTTLQARYISYFVPNGMLAQYWKPTTLGANYKLPSKAVLAPLAEHTAHFTVVSGTRNSPKGRQSGGGHGQGGASANTGMPNAGPNQAKKAGISADQIVANARASTSPISSLQLGMPDEPGNDDLGLAREYTNSMSWADTSTNLPPISDRNVILKRLFPNGQVTGDATSATVMAEDASANNARNARLRSILDAAVSQTKELQAKMGSIDKARLDQFLTGIREVEVSLQSEGNIGNPTGGSAACVPLSRVDQTKNLDTIFDQWDKIITTALQCNRTSVVNFMFAAAQSFRHYPNIGIDQEHHLLSHYTDDFPAGSDPTARIEQLRQIQVYEMMRFGKLLSRLKAVPDGTGTLLDNSIIVVFSEMSESDHHGFDDMPVLVAGGGNGRIISNGQHLRSNDNVEFAQVLLASIRAAGVDIASMGSSNETKSFPGLTS